MKGYVNKYFTDKQFGFIKSDDNIKYFFHRTNFINADEIEEGLFVEFEVGESKKGLIATNIRKSKDTNKYILPDEVLTSKKPYIRNWDIIEESNWNINASSKNSPDDAKENLIILALENDVNGLVNLKYYRSTGEDGNYKYSIHHFSADCVNVARKSPKGNLSKEEVKTNIDKRFSEIKKEYDDAHNINLKRCYFTWFTIISFIVIFNVNDNINKYILETLNLNSGFYLLCILLIYGFFFGTTRYKGGWLHEIY